MIKLGGLVDLRPQWLGEAEDDKYVSIGFGRYKQKGKEDDDNAPTFKKDDSGKYVPTGGKAAKGGDSSAKKDKPKVNIFDKPKKDKVAKGSDSSAEKIDNAYDAKDFEPIVSSLKGKIDDQEYEEISDEMKALEVMQDEIEDLEDNGENTYNEKIELDFAVEDLQDRIKQALSKDKKSEPKKDKKSDTPKLSIDTDDMGDYEGMSISSANQTKFYLNKELGLDGQVDINNNGAIEYNIPGSTDTLYIGNDEKTGKKFSVSLADEDGNSNDTYKAFDNDADAMAYAKELGQKLKGGANESSTKLRDLLPEKFTATSKETGTVSVFKTKDARDAAVKAGTHEKRKDDKDGDDKKDTPKVNIFDKPKKDKKSEPKSDSSEKAPRDDKNRIIVPKELELKGDVFNDAWYQKKFAWIKTKEEQDFVTDLIKKSSPQVVNKLSRDPEKLRAAIQKQIDKKKNEPSTDSANSRPGKPEVNKAVRKKAESLGITPQKLGKEEYESRMSKAAVEALTDSNFHSEARKLIAVLEDKPEWAKDPRQDPNMPDIFSPEYEEWQKTSVYSSELYDSAEGTDEIAHEASNQAGWDGVAALDAIAFDLKMNGSKKLAAKIQSAIEDTNESTMRLTKMEWRK